MGRTGEGVHNPYRRAPIRSVVRRTRVGVGIVHRTGAIVGKVIGSRRMHKFRRCADGVKDIVHVLNVVAMPRRNLGMFTHVFAGLEMRTIPVAFVVTEQCNAMRV